MQAVPVGAPQPQMSYPLPQYAQMPAPAGMPQMPAGAPSYASIQQQQLQQQQYQQCLQQQYQQQQRSGNAVNGTAVAATALGAIAGVTLMAVGAGGGGSLFDGGESFAPVLHGLGTMGAMAGRAAGQGNRSTPAGNMNNAVRGTLAAVSVVRGITGMFGI